MDCSSKAILGAEGISVVGSLRAAGRIVVMNGIFANTYRLALFNTLHVQRLVIATVFVKGGWRFSVSQHT